MKLATMIATVLVSLTATAGNGLSYSYHDYDAALGGIKLENACVTATEVQSIQPQTICAELVPTTRREVDMDVTDWNCAKWEVSHLTSSRTFQRSFCAKWARESDNDVCVAFGSKTEFMPQTIKVATVTAAGENDNFPGVVSSFTFPSCRKTAPVPTTPN